MTVLDASAILAYAQAEPGSDEVHSLIAQSVCSAVNWSEVALMSLRKGVSPAVLRARMEALGLGIVAFQAEHAEIAADIEALVRPFGLSLADRACLATALALGRPAVTADRVWATIEGLSVDVRLIR